MARKLDTKTRIFRVLRHDTNKKHGVFRVYLSTDGERSIVQFSWNLIKKSYPFFNLQIYEWLLKKKQIRETGISRQIKLKKCILVKQCPGPKKIRNYYFTKFIHDQMISQVKNRLNIIFDLQTDYSLLITSIYIF